MTKSASTIAPKPRWQRAAGERIPVFVEQWSRRAFWTVCVVAAAAVGAASYFWWPAAFFGAPVLLFFYVGLRDMTQSRRTILRNYPVLGHLRYFFESIRPELRQYFVESDYEETPFSREMRSVVYQRAKNQLDKVPFGTRHPVYDVGYEWIAQSLEPCQPEPDSDRVLIGEHRCDKPYSASLLNISAMSFGSLSARAIEALNGGAKLGRFYHNTGEGGISPYHKKCGGDLVYQLGTGYFGSRDQSGGFDPELFTDRMAEPTVRMCELKLSQGAKPAHGGILPGAKVTPEIAQIRGVEVGKTVLSPPSHSAFSGPTGLLEFVTKLRELGGKPVGFKLCVGQREEFLGIVKAMVETGLYPDFITVDGGEGGTGAAPIEFSNSVGMPLFDGIQFVHNALIGAGVRDHIKLISAGKIATGYHICRQLALGADLCNSARSMMLAVGCIQALKCHSNKCPTGVATQNPKLMKGLVVAGKTERVARYHHKTIEAVLELVGAAGLRKPSELRPYHLFRRVSSTQVMHLGQIYEDLEPGCLVAGSAPEPYRTEWNNASTVSFSACHPPVARRLRGTIMPPT